ncbi:MAG: nitrate reductase cytochrome c-type subunit [Gammaproteobacteria bacterium]|nr:nitrate reductase cytochrome c-type subunit [Gammaproteobacteria bacterium]MCP5136628.1 nitrate reductase cytochrome c-type subunit [Gammaproteobacteria bacterium]
MKIASLLTGVALVALVGVLQYEFAHAGDGIADSDMGLTKTSVFDDPTPVASHQGGAKPELAYPGAPPQIPHAIDGLVPVTTANNACMGCHNNPALQGKKMAGVPTAIPVSHYVNTRTGESTGNKVSSQRYVCTQCHTPQADVKPLVSNTF